MSEIPRMRWASASSRLDEPAAAATAVAGELREQLGGESPDLLIAFVSGPGRERTAAVTGQLRRELPAVTFAATSARGVVTREHEVEQGVGLSVVAARLPGVEVKPFLMLQDAWAEPVDSATAFDQRAPGARGAELVIVLGDPFSLDVDRVLALFNRWTPGVRVVGGLASAAARPGGNTLVLNDWTAHEGGLAIALHGALRADVVVSQGCEPFGPPLDVTHAEDNLIFTLDGQPAVERIEQVLRAVPEKERDRLKQGLYLGRPARGEASGRGDYLIRNLLGADRDRGALAVADVVGLREKVRLHVRDARAAVEDLEMLLSPQAFDTAPSAALLFACNGRGRALFGEPDRDITSLQQALKAAAPCAGMFCAGEVGPVGERNFLHGHTASIIIVRPR
ncbi:MAG TPA: FIST N-terminal domain-containing protein [Methylomirabilota bacterium]|jgi:small ligand-binding sensory domain FIST|nr:FIST N-terminal domain-containing protein [Methylomirabilota bacterium]